MKTRAFLIALLLAALLPAAAARADLVVERTVREFGPDLPEDGSPEDAPIIELRVRRYTFKMAADRVRETCHETGVVNIVRLDKKLIWTLSENNTYRQLSFEDIDAAAEKARQRLIRRLPLVEDGLQRERLEIMLGVREDPEEITVERPGEKKTIAGQECELVVVRLGEAELFSAFLAERGAPVTDKRWLTLGGLFSEKAAAKLAELEGLLMEATFPLADGGRLEISTQKVSEEDEKKDDYADPAGQGYSLTGTSEKAEK